MSFATGRNSRRICDRCARAFDYPDLKKEPGTRWVVCDECNDGMFSLMMHPQNGPFPVSPDPQAIRDPRNQPSLVSVVEASVWLSLVPFN